MISKPGRSNVNALPVFCIGKCIWINVVLIARETMLYIFDNLNYVRLNFDKCAHARQVVLRGSQSKFLQLHSLLFHPGIALHYSIYSISVRFSSDPF